MVFSGHDMKLIRVKGNSLKGFHARMGYDNIKVSFVNLVVLIRTVCKHAFSEVYCCERALAMLSWNKYCKSSRM